MFKHILLSTFKIATVIFMLSMTLMSCQENQQKIQDSAGKSLPASNTPNPSKHDFNKANYALEKPRILSKAAKYLSVLPKTVTADIAVRSHGGAHDFFSEGDYWWPDPHNPNGPYIQKDGQSRSTDKVVVN